MVIGYSLLVYGILSILLAAESRSHGKTQLIVISYWLLVIRLIKMINILNFRQFRHFRHSCPPFLGRIRHFRQFRH